MSVFHIWLPIAYYKIIPNKIKLFYKSKQIQKITLIQYRKLFATLEMQDRSEIVELFERSFNDHLEKLERIKRKLEMPEYSFVFLKRGKHEEK